MERETIIDNKYATMWYYPDKKIVAHHIKRFIYGEDFQKFLLAGTEVMRERNANKWLSDDRDSPVLRREDTDWGAANWFPQTLAAGWKYWAIVKPTQLIGEMTVKRVLEDYYNAGVTAMVFTDFDEALAWLESQPD